MHALYAACGIMGAILLYFATTFLAVNSIQKAAQWFEKKRNCKEWPTQQEDLTVAGPDHESIACILPDISRGRLDQARNEFDTKTILQNAAHACTDQELCNE